MIHKTCFIVFWKKEVLLPQPVYIYIYIYIKSVIKKSRLKSFRKIYNFGNMKTGLSGTTKRRKVVSSRNLAQGMTCSEIV